MTLQKSAFRGIERQKSGIQTHLQGILARKALVTMGARKRLDGQMDALVPLEIMVPIETLRTLITPKRSILSRPRTGMRRRWAPVHLLHAGEVAAVEIRGDDGR